MKTKIRGLSILAIVCCMAIGSGAHGIAITSQNSSSWNFAATWNPSQVPTSADDVTIRVFDSITLTTAGEQCRSLTLDRLLTIFPGADLTVTTAGTVLGNAGSGTVFNSGTFTNTGVLTIGTGTAAGAFNVFATGTLVTTGDVNIGIGGIASFLQHVGSASTNVGNDLNVDSAGSLLLRPSANGLAGLSPISVTNDLNLGAGSSVDVTFIDYTPSAGDSWDIITFGGSQTGTFTNIVNTSANLPVGLGLQIASSVGTVTVTVVSLASPVPAVTYWGLTALCAALVLGGAFYLRRIRGLRTA